MSSRTHLFIPDVQVKPGVPTDHLQWIGRFIVDEQKKDPVIIMIGDWYDLPSLSSYDRGKASFEGRRYRADVQAGHDALKAQLESSADEQIRLYMDRLEEVDKKF